MKNIIITFLIVIIVALGVCTYNLYNKLDSQRSENASLEVKLGKQEKQISSLQNTLDTIKSTINEEKEDNEKNNSKKVKFDSSKMKISDEDMEYTEESDNQMDVGITVEVKNGKAYITTDTSNDNYSSAFENGVKLDSQEITGFKTDVKEAYIGIIGTQDIEGTDILFLMDDGTVEYVEVKDIAVNKNFKSKGVIEKLENIAKFIDASTFKANYGGYLTVIAIDEDGYSYDINELLK